MEHSANLSRLGYSQKAQRIAFAKRPAAAPAKASRRHGGRPKESARGWSDPGHVLFELALGAKMAGEPGAGFILVRGQFGAVLRVRTERQNPLQLFASFRAQP